MTNDPDSIREHLLQQLPTLDTATVYKAPIAKTLERNETNIGRERIWVTTFWVFCVLSAASYIWFGPGASQMPRGPFLACIFLMWGSLEVLKHHINSSRLDLLKEIKQVQVQLVDLQASRNGMPGV